MSFRITKLTVGKGRTTGDEKAGKWNREYYKLEAEIQDESQVELAKGTLETLVNTWLNGQTVSPTPQDRTKLPYNIDKVPWQDRQNEKGSFQVCNDESNADFRNLRTFVKEHAGGKASTKDSQGVLWFVWLFNDQKTLGRKKSQFKRR